MLYDDQSRPNSRNKKTNMEARKTDAVLEQLRNRYGVVVTDPEQIAQEIVQMISSTMTHGFSHRGRMLSLLGPLLRTACAPVGTLPDRWSVALLNPKLASIPTSGDLRPPVLQNSALKWVTATILLHLKDLIIYLTPPDQRGFVPGRNLHNHLFEVHVSWRAMENGLFAKAFNS